MNVFSIVLAGGEGKRLAPLTKDRAKPAVLFGGNYVAAEEAVARAEMSFSVRRPPRAAPASMAVPT